MYIEWTLPVNDGTNVKEPRISNIAKVHCYATEQKKIFPYMRVGTSLCGKYKQDMDYYETFRLEDLTEEQVCKKCLSAYRKKYSRELKIDE